MLVINLKETGQTQKLGSGSLYMKALQKMTETMIRNYKNNGSQKRDTSNRLSHFAHGLTKKQGIVSKPQRHLED